VFLGLHEENCLLVPQRYHRVYACRKSRRYVTCQECDGSEHYAHGKKSNWIRGTDSKEKASQVSCHSERRHYPHQDSDENQCGVT
jgi:hypothetical protein